MSSVLKKADKLNLSLSLSPQIWTDSDVNVVLVDILCE